MFERLRSLVGRSHLLSGLILAQLGTVGGSFLINILSARALGPDGRGQIAFLLQVSYLVGAALPLGRDRSALRLRRGDICEQSRFPSSLATAPTVLAAVAGAVCLLILLILGSHPVAALGFWLLLLGNLSSRFFRTDAVLSGSTGRFVGPSLTGQILLVAAGGVLLAVQNGSMTWWILAYGISQFLPFLAVSIVESLRKDDSVPLGHQVRVGATSDETASTKRLGLQLLPSTFTEMAATKIDKVLLPLLGSFGQLGYYTVTVSLIDFSILPFRQHVDTQIPQWAAAYGRGQSRMLPTLVRPMTAALVVVGLVAGCAALLLVPLFGHEYAPAIGLIPWLAVASWIHIAALYINGHAVARSRPRAASAMFITGALVSLPLYVFLIPTRGAEGAAMTLAVGYLISVVVGGFLVTRRSRTDGNGPGTLGPSVPNPQQPET